MKLILFIKKAYDYILDKAYVRGHHRFTKTGEKIWIDPYYDKRTLKQKAATGTRQKKRVNTTEEELKMRAEKEREYLKELESEHERAKSEHGTRRKMRKDKEVGHFYGEHSFEEVMANFTEQRRRVEAKIAQIESDLKTRVKGESEKEAKRQNKNKPKISDATQKYISKLRSPDTKKFAQDYADYVYGISDKEPGLPEKRQSAYQDIANKINFMAFFNEGVPIKAKVKESVMNLDATRVKEVVQEVKSEKVPDTKRESIAFSVDAQTTYKMKHRIVDLSELIPSNKVDGSINSNYNQLLQPRDRTRAASMEQIQDKILNEMNPAAMVYDFHSVDRGTPIIGSDNMVESGNGRTIALTLAIEKRPDKWQAYQDALKEKLSEYGFTEKDLEGIKNPVLVRERITGGDDMEFRQKFCGDANCQTGAQMASIERAMTDSKLINDKMIYLLNINEKSEGEYETIEEALKKPRNADFVKAFLAKIPFNETTSMKQADGRLNMDGINRIKAALFVYAFPPPPGTKLVKALLDSTDTNIKNFQTAIGSSLAIVAQAESLIRSGQRENVSLCDDFGAAIDMLSTVKDNDQNVYEYVQQRHMSEVASRHHPGEKYGDAKRTTPLQDEILVKFDELSRSPKKLRLFFNKYAELVDRMPDPNQTVMSGYGKKSNPKNQKEMWDLLISSTNEKAEPKAKELF